MPGLGERVKMNLTDPVEVARDRERIASVRLTHGMAACRQAITDLQEHIQADHETLKYLWDIHSPTTNHPRLALCVADGQRFPCRTRRALMGERFE
jgi:hypothetical protein